MGTERFSSDLWKRPFVSEQEKRTKTLSKSSVSSQELVQDFLESRDSLIQQDLKEDSGFRITRRYTGLMDRFIRSLFLQSGFREKVKELQEERLALVALGSYGRRELCLGSDIDLMVVYRGSLSPEMKEIVLRGLYPLWDANLDVGYTIIEVSARDKIGLLYEMAKGVFSLGLDIRFAKVNSDKEKMTGVFYVRDSGGQKILEEEHIEKMKREIISAIQL